MNLLGDIFGLKKNYFPFTIEVENITLISPSKVLFTGKVVSGKVTRGQKASLKFSDDDFNYVYGDEGFKIKEIESFKNGNVKVASEGENVGIVFEGEELYDIDFKSVTKIINYKLS